jgi:hypothetical protein
LCALSPLLSYLYEEENAFVASQYHVIITLEDLSKEREREREKKKNTHTHTHTHLLPNFLPPMQCSPRYRKDVATAAEAVSQKTSHSLLVLFDPKSLRK